MIEEYRIPPPVACNFCGGEIDPLDISISYTTTEYGEIKKIYLHQECHNELISDLNYNEAY